MNVKTVDGYDYPEEVRALFSEYTDMLIANDAEFKKYLAVQNYDEEIAHLKSKYGLPEGGDCTCFLLTENRQSNLRNEATVYTVGMAWKKVGRDAGRKDYSGSTKNRIFVYGA